MTPTPDTTPAAVEAMIERLLAGDLCTVELAPEAAAMLREWCARAIAAEAEAAMLRRERDEARDQFDHHVVWASDQSAKLEAEAAALREALTKMRGYAVHDDGCGVNALLMPRLPLTKQCTCGLSALIKETSDGL